MHLGWFPVKKRPGTRAITNSGQLQNNCPLFLWQNQDNFMRSVIILSYNVVIIDDYDQEGTKDHSKNSLTTQQLHDYTTMSKSLLQFEHCYRSR